jgi:hypothetical protein
MTKTLAREVGYSIPRLLIPVAAGFRYSIDRVSSAPQLKLGTKISQHWASFGLAPLPYLFLNIQESLMRVQPGAPIGSQTGETSGHVPCKVVPAIFG